MRKLRCIRIAILVMAVCSGCTLGQETVETIKTAATPTPAPTLSPEERVDALLEQPEVKEAITVGDAQVALRQGEKEGCVEFVLYQEEREEILASLDGILDLSKCHIEPFDGEILGYQGFYLFERNEYGPYSSVKYIGLRDNKKAKILIENHAIYRRKKKRFETYFDEVRDVDGDGIREVISNNAYVADGGQDAVLYDCDPKGRILEGGLGNLIDCDYYSGRATDFDVWYHPKNRKVWITFYPNRYAKKQVTRKYKCNKKNLEKIPMHKRMIWYRSDNLKDLENYD